MKCNRKHGNVAPALPNIKCLKNSMSALPKIECSSSRVVGRHHKTTTNNQMTIANTKFAQSQRPLISTMTTPVPPQSVENVENVENVPTGSVENDIVGNAFWNVAKRKRCCFQKPGKRTQRQSSKRPKTLPTLQRVTVFFHNVANVSQRECPF